MRRLGYWRWSIFPAPLCRNSRRRWVTILNTGQLGSRPSWYVDMLVLGAVTCSPNLFHQYQSAMKGLREIHTLHARDGLGITHSDIDARNTIIPSVLPPAVVFVGSATMRHSAYRIEGERRREAGELFDMFRTELGCCLESFTFESYNEFH